LALFFEKKKFVKKFSLRSVTFKNSIKPPRGSFESVSVFSVPLESFAPFLIRYDATITIPEVQATSRGVCPSLFSSVYVLKKKKKPNKANKQTNNNKPSMAAPQSTNV